MVSARQLLSAVFLIAVCAHPAWALPEDFLLNIPQVKGPEAGSLAGTLARFNPSASEMARGSMQLSLPLAFDQLRGPLLADIVPSYSMENGISEWGMGWENQLDIRRFRKIGDLDFKTDEFISPWGRLQLGTDGYWYPRNLKKLIRIQILPDRAVARTPEGLVLEFSRVVAGPVPDSAYAFYLNKVSNPKGQITLLSWSADASRPVLDEVRYGGYTQNELPYRIKFNYEERPKSRNFFSFRSGRSAEVSRKITSIQFFDNIFSVMQARWAYSIVHQETSYSPAFYLHKLQRTFSSGKSEPPILLSYESFEDFLPLAKFEQSNSLDDILRNEGGAGLLANQRISIYDHDLDGRIDIELGQKNKLYLQSDQGFKESVVYQQNPELSPCLPLPRDTNRGRQIARLGGPYAEPRVILNYPGNSGETHITVCKLSGEIVYDQVFRRIFTPDRLTAFGDINNDGKPDYIRLGEDSLSLLENKSGNGEIAFQVAGEFPFNAKNNLPTQMAIADINGDGIADIFSLDSSAARVFFGKGNMTFTNAVIMPFFNTLDRTFTMSGANASFVDMNSDGVSDLILTKGSQAVTLVNRGDSFKVVSLPFSLGLSNEGDAIIGNINGGGDPMIFRVVGGNRVFALRLSSPGMHLLREYDDGQGNVLQFKYAYGSGAPGQVRMHKQISSIERRITGKGKKSYSFSYQSPQLDASIPSLLGYGFIEEKNYLSKTQVSFDNPEVFPGQVRSLVVQDRSRDLDGRKTIDEKDYRAFSFAGIKSFRAFESRHLNEIGGVRSKAKIFRQKWSEEGCEESSLSLLEGDEYRTEYSYFKPENLLQHLTCFPATVKVRGKHIDDRFDFEQTWIKSYNEIGQTVKVIQESNGSQRLLQDIAYDDYKRVSQIKELKGTIHSFSYEEASEALVQHQTNSGLIEKVTERYPNGQFKLLELFRGSSKSFQTRFDYDDLERLSGFGNNIDSHASNDFIHKFEYSFAGAGQLAKLSQESWFDSDSTLKSNRYFAADGDLIVESMSFNSSRILNRPMRFDPEVGLNTVGASISNNAEGLDPLTQWDDIFGKSYPVSQEQDDGFGQPYSSKLAHGKDVWEQHDFSYQADSLGIRNNDSQNQTYVASSIQDAGQRVVMKIDEIGAKWTYVYDVANRLHEVILPTGEKQIASYNSWGEIERIERSGLGSVSFEYDNRGLRIAASYTNSLGIQDRVVSFNYDVYGRLVLEEMNKDQSKQSISYFYDGNTGTPEIYADEKGQLTAIKGEDFLFKFRHDLKGRLVEQNKSNFSSRTQVNTKNSYYSDDRVKNQIRSYKISSATRLSNWEYLLDKEGRLKSIRVNGKTLVDLSRDMLARIDSAILGSGQATVGFKYDPYTQLLAGYNLTQGSKRQEYYSAKDNRGNIGKESWNIGDQTDIRTYAYDQRSFLAAATLNNQVDEFSYDQSGLFEAIPGNGFTLKEQDDFGRVQIVNGWKLTYGPNGQVTNALRSNDRIDFSYDHEQNQIARLKNGKATHVWLDGVLIRGDDIVEPLQISGINFGVLVNGELHPLLSDPRGTVLAAEDYASIPESYGATSLHNPWSDLMDFAGKPYDSDLKLIRMGVRYYDAGRKHFTSFDPLFFEDVGSCLVSSVECNMYSYARNNPLKYIDPSGKAAEDSFANRYDRLVLAGKTDQANAMIGGRAEVVAIVMGTLEDLKPLPELLSLGGFTPLREAVQSIAGSFGRRAAGEAAEFGLSATRPASSLAQSSQLKNSLIAQEISAGHAFEKHVIQKGEFPGITTKEQFSERIESFLNDPNTLYRNLNNSRGAYWNDSFGDVMIRNPKAADGGTFFKPDAGRNYFETVP